MKKILLALLLLLILAVAAVYLLIPRQLHVSKSAPYRINSLASSRFLMNEKNWPLWWPGETAFQYDGYTYTLKKTTPNAFELEAESGDNRYEARLLLAPLFTDSSILTLRTTLEPAGNVWARWIRYRQASRIKASFDRLLDSLGHFLENDITLYGFKIIQDTVPDSILISTKKRFDHAPVVAETEAMIQQLQQYIQTHGARATNPPMLHTFEIGPDDFESMVAIPVNKELPESGGFAPKRVLFRGNLLSTQVTGGPARIAEAFRQIELYKTDHSRVPPAIPYEQMITNRAAQPDTNRWVTKICYPVL